MRFRATCTCRPTIPAVSGAALACVACGSTIYVEAHGVATPTMVSSINLPVDATADRFNRSCRSGLVSGATKKGRVWSCTLEAWNHRAPAPTPRGLPPKGPKAPRAPKTPKSAPAALSNTVSGAFLEEMGAVKRTA